VLQWPRDVPLDGKPADVHAVVSNYSRWLQQTEIPKLFFYASPGGIIDAEDAVWVKKTFPNIASFDLGEGIHFVQEDNPHFIGEKLAEWYAKLN
ncbi:MAG: haloalkane dehalogenase, partial [Chloroflexi bacterium]|nr:haloalkane dehalogenase [Chloroflexota bacterium]